MASKSKSSRLLLCICSAGIVFALAFIFVLTPKRVSAQQVPAAPPQGQPAAGGRGGRGGLPGATPEQTQAVTDMSASLASLVTADTAARNDLGNVAITDGKNASRMAAATESLRAAELALASARAAAFAQLQAGPNKLNTEQVTALIAGGGNVQGGRGGRGGGGPAVEFSPAQNIALVSMTVSATAATDARNDLARASLTSPVNAADLRAKADAVAKAESALAVLRATEFVRVGGPALNLTADQLTAVIANNGLPRGGNTSPGGTFASSDYTGFTNIWDGKTFTGWDGETDGWKIDHDAIQMDTARLPGQHHLHFTGLPGISPIVKDFDLKVEYKASGNYNGGIQYRSRLLKGHGPNRSISDPATMADPLGQPLPAGITTQAAANAAGIAGQPWQVSGYQYDITATVAGSLYEGQGRGYITNVGEVVEAFPNGLKFVIGHTVDNPMQFQHPASGLDGELNQIEIIARGNTMVQLLNGHVITVTIDDDPVRRASSGIISLQCEGGGALWYRNVYLKKLEPVK